MNKSDLTDYAREEYLEFGNSRTKNIAPSSSFSADLERYYILAFTLQPGLSSQASLYFISQGINKL